MERYPQSLINISVRSKPDLKTVPEIAAAVRQAEAALGDRGRVLVRYSGTQRMCRIMVEGPSVEETEKYSGMIADAVRKTLA
jgi:phosphoglucosamine mutase